MDETTGQKWTAFVCMKLAGQQNEKRPVCGSECDFFDNLIKCTKKAFLKPLTIHELNINILG